MVARTFILALAILLLPAKADNRSPQSPFGAHAFAFTSPEDMMKNLPKAFSNMMGGMGLSESPTLKLSMREYRGHEFKSRGQGYIRN